MMVTCSNPQAERYPGSYISSLFQNKTYLIKTHTHCYYHRYLFISTKEASNLISKKFANSSISDELFNPPYGCILHLPFVKHSTI